MPKKKAVSEEQIAQDAKNKLKKTLIYTVVVGFIIVVTGILVTDYIFENEKKKLSTIPSRTSVHSQIKKKNKKHPKPQKKIASHKVDKIIQSLSDEEIDKIFMSFADEQRRKRLEEAKKKAKNKEKEMFIVGGPGDKFRGGVAKAVLPHDKTPIVVGENQGKFVKKGSGQQQGIKKVDIKELIKRLVKENQQLSQKLKAYQENFKLVIYGIVCDNNVCVAKTNVGYVRQGITLPNGEKVVLVDQNGIKTNKRYIPW